MHSQNLDFVTSYSYDSNENKYIEGSKYEVIVSFNDASSRETFALFNENILGEKDLAEAINTFGTSSLKKIRRYETLADKKVRSLGPNRNFPSSICYDDKGNVQTLSWYKGTFGNNELLRTVSFNFNKIDKAFENLCRDEKTGEFSSQISDSFSHNFFEKIKHVHDENLKFYKHFNIAQKRHVDHSVSFRLTLSRDEVIMLAIDNAKYFPSKQIEALWNNPNLTSDNPSAPTPCCF